MRKLKKLILPLLCFAVTVMFIMCSEEVKTEIINAIALCGRSVIPGLFPIMCITLVITNSGAVSLVPKKAAPLFIFLISQFSGYPVGAKLLSSMVQRGHLSENSAQNVLPSMICAGPAFIINIAGAQMFSNVFLGIRLYVCQITANLILFLLSGGLKIKINRFANNIKASEILTSSVRQGVDSTISICAYVILFSALTAIISTLFGNHISKYFTYLFEITGAVYNSNDIYVTCAALSWSGVCVIFQVLSAADNIKIKVKRLFLVRIVGAIISCTILKISFYIFPYTSNVISNLNSSPQPTVTHNIYFAVFFIFSLFVFLLSLSRRTPEKFSKIFTDEFN